MSSRRDEGLPMDSLDTLHARILATGDATSIDDIAETLATLHGVATRCRELKALLDDRLRERIESTGQDIVIGELRYYVAAKTVTRCREPAPTLLALLDAAGGSADDVAACLAANGFKVGACRQLLGDAFGQHFETSVETELATGKPLKRLQSADTRFTGSHRGGSR
jgi:hypothetical protein